MKDDIEDEELEKGSDIELVRSILADEGEGLDALSQAIEATTDPQLKEILEAIQEDEQKHDAALQQWLEMSGEGDGEEEEPPEDEEMPDDEGEDLGDLEGEPEPDPGPEDDLPVDLDDIPEDEEEDDDLDKEDTTGDLIDDIREVLAEHEAEKAEDEPEDEDEEDDEDLPDFLKSDEDEEDEDEDVIEKVLKCYRVPIRIKKGDQQIIYGIISEPNVTDLQGDRLSESEIAKACHKFMQTSQRISKEHAEPAKADIIESYIAPVDFTCGGQSVRKGSWVMAVKVHDPGLWQAIKKGEITGFSIGGHGTRIPI